MFRYYHIFVFIALWLTVTVLLQVAAQEDLKEGEVHLGSFGYICTSECRRKGYNYSWCEARHPVKHHQGIKYWDYCSKKQEHDHRGRRCWHEHACGNHGYSYKWCYVGETGSSWGYCGLNVDEKPGDRPS